MVNNHWWVFAGVVSCWLCYSKAEKLNRNQLFWSVFGFVIPIISVIVVNLMKPLARNMRDSEILDQD